MNIIKQKATIGGAHVKKSQYTSFSGGKPEQTIEIIVPISIEASREVVESQPWKRLFPFALETMSLIAGKEGDEKGGLNISAKGKVEPMQIDIYDSELNAQPALIWPVCEVKSKPVLNIDQTGEGKIQFKVSAIVKKDDMGEISCFANADILMSMSSQQIELDFSKTHAVEDQPKEKKPRKKKAAEAVQYKMTNEAAEFLKSAEKIHEEVKSHEIIDRARSLAQLRMGGTSEAKITLDLDLIKEVVDSTVSSPLNSNDSPFMQ